MELESGVTNLLFVRPTIQPLTNKCLGKAAPPENVAWLPEFQVTLDSGSEGTGAQNIDLRDQLDPNISFYLSIWLHLPQIRNPI